MGFTVDSSTAPELREALRVALNPWTERCFGFPLEDVITDVVGVFLDFDWEGRKEVE